MILKIQKKLLGIKYFKKVKIKYNQAKVKEVLKFLDLIEKDDFVLAEWVVDFLEENSKKKFTNHDKWQIYIYHEAIFEEIKKTYFKWVFSEEKGGKKDNTPICSLLAFVSKEAGVNWYSLLYKMTFDDLKLFADWAVWNLNDQTKKGKRLNRLKMIGKKAKRTEKDKEAIRKKLSLIK